LTRLVDDAGLWEARAEDVTAYVEREVAAAIRVLDDRAGHDVVLVTNEVGWGVVPEHRSGRLFRDLLGEVNRRFADACDEVHLVVAGRVLRL
jgi:adenosylcobinamide kinase/adenosylcobinamide-phosphate guanylyltransferase